MNRILKRSVIALLVLTAVMAIAEGVLRQSYSILPSLSVSTSPFSPEGRPATLSHGPDPVNCHSHALAGGQKPPVSWARSFSGANPLTLFVVGDSGALGSGVSPEKTYAYHLAEKLHQESKRGVELYNLGFNAAGYCIYLQELHRHLDIQTPDIVVLHMFADDLEQKALVMSGGVLRADPARLKTSLFRRILAGSYAINWLWWKGVTVIVSVTTDGGTRLPKWVEHGPRIIPEETQDNFESSIRHLQARLAEKNVAQVSFLASPSGWSMCPDDPSPTSECGWLVHDQQTIAGLLDSSGIPWLDLRLLWEDSDAYVLEMERRFYQEFGRLPVHPNEKGHEKIFNEIWPAVDTAWKKQSN